MAHRNPQQPYSQSAFPPQLTAVHLHAAGNNVGAEAPFVAVPPVTILSMTPASSVATRPAAMGSGATTNCWPAVRHTWCCKGMWQPSARRRANGRAQLSYRCTPTSGSF
jgi:hypothetical protein